jgi:hypothetical protein
MALVAIVAAVMFAQPALLDRTLALVGGQPITLSDARAAVALGLIDDPKGSLADVTARLVDRALVLREVQRYAPPAPEESAVESRLAQVRQRLGGSLKTILDTHGFTETRVRGWIRDDLRTLAYLAQRFASASLPSDTEVAAVYNRQRAEFDKSGLTFEQAAPIIRERLIEERRRELVVDWVADLRRRTDVVIIEQVHQVHWCIRCTRLSEEHADQFGAVEQAVADDRGDRAAAQDVHHAPQRAE